MQGEVEGKDQARPSPLDSGEPLECSRFVCVYGDIQVNPFSTCLVSSAWPHRLFTQG